MAQLISLSASYERIAAPEKKFNEVVVFVHHFGGHRRSFNKQIDFVNSLGFDVITFDLPMNHVKDWTKKVPVGRYWSFGLRHVWADKIAEVLSQVNDNKILFTFSAPSAAALMAIQRQDAVGVVGWICDGGPFLHLKESADRLLNEGTADEFRHKIFKNAIVRKNVARFFSFAMGAKNYEKDMRDALVVLPDGFPILSLQGAIDPLVLPIWIDGFFALNKEHLKLTTVLLSRTGHLNGMTVEPDLYTQKLKEFLLTINQICNEKVSES